MKVLIPSPPHYANRLIKALKDADPYVQIVSLPMIESSPLPDEAKRLVAETDHYDYVILTSRMAIDTFANAWQREPHKCQFAAMGKDADYVAERLGERPSIIPDEASPRGIVAKLSAVRDIMDKRIAVVGPRFAGIEEPTTIPDMIKDLESLGCETVRIDAYETRPTSDSLHEQAYRMIASDEIDIIAFTSAGEVFSFVNGYAGDVGQLLSHTHVACFGPYTALRAESIGVHVDFVSSRFVSFADYAAEIVLGTNGHRRLDSE